MTKKDIIAQIELMNEWERVIEEAKAEVEAIKDSIKAEMADRDLDELEAGSYIVRYKTVATSRFDSTSFKKTYEDLQKEYFPLFCKSMMQRRTIDSVTLSTVVMLNCSAHHRSNKRRVCSQLVNVFSLSCWVWQYTINSSICQLKLKSIIIKTLLLYRSEQTPINTECLQACQKEFIGSKNPLPVKIWDIGRLDENLRKAAKP